MSIRNAGLTIKEARIYAGLTLEQLSEGVCFPHSLSRIENGKIGVSPSTFKALMEHAGTPCQVYPQFENWTDYNCFCHLTRARFHLDAWQLEAAYTELAAIEELEWNNNKFYYQEWMLLHCKLQFRSRMVNHQHNLDNLISALHISRPDISFDNFKKLLLSINEMELLIAIAHELLYLNQTDTCLSICSQLDSYLQNINFSFLEKDRLLAELTICYTKYLIASKNYPAALKLADSNRHQVLCNGDYSKLFELNFLTALSYYYNDNKEKSLQMFKDTFYSSHAVKSPYATTCKSYVRSHLNLDLPKHILDMNDIPLQSYEAKKIIDTSAFTDGIYDIDSADIITIGKIIHALRISQGVSQQTLCLGLCSKSKLSKIENDTLYPEISLAEALLQRLGISEREFTFWGNSKESKFHELKFRLMHSEHLSDATAQTFLSDMETLIESKDNLLRQHLLMEKALQEESEDVQIEVLWKALHCTLKDFDITNITNYRLSWAELTILNNLAFAYRHSATPKLSIVFAKKILEYQQLFTQDIIFQSQIYPGTLRTLTCSLYTMKYFQEMIDIFNDTDTTFLRYWILMMGSTFFYYSQALGECTLNDELPLYTRYACGIENISEHNDNSQLLIQAIYDDFSINVNF